MIRHSEVRLIPAFMHALSQLITLYFHTFTSNIYYSTALGYLFIICSNNQCNICIYSRLSISHFWHSLFFVSCRLSSLLQVSSEHIWRRIGFQYGVNEEHVSNVCPHRSPRPRICRQCKLVYVEFLNRGVAELLKKGSCSLVYMCCSGNCNCDITAPPPSVARRTTVLVGGVGGTG